MTLGELSYVGPVLLYTWDWPNKQSTRAETQTKDNQVVVQWGKSDGQTFIKKIDLAVKPNDLQLFPNASQPGKSTF